MKHTLQLLFFLVISYTAKAQYTLIPDSGFEQELIYQNIDSDGVVNGQVLTSDIDNITELIIEDGYYIEDLTGIQDFTNLEKLVILYSGITELDVSQNLQLKILDCSSNNLTTLDVSSNTLLEELHIGNYGIDVAPFNMIQEIDLSQNPNIKMLDAFDMYIKKINLKNGNNNPDMSIGVALFPWGIDGDPDYDPYEIRNTVCIEVDDVEAALNNLSPYSYWEIDTWSHVAVNFTDDVTACALSIPSFSESEITMYPNPASDNVVLENLEGSTTINIVNLTGKLIYTTQTVHESLQVDLTDFRKGIYLVQVISRDKAMVKKLVVN
jgi:hypothetical protein